MWLAWQRVKSCVKICLVKLKTGDLDIDKQIILKLFIENMVL